MHLPRGSAAPAARPRSACVRCLQMGEGPRGKRPPLLISAALPPSPRIPGRRRGATALAGRGNRAPLGSGLGASQGCARRERGLPCRGWLGITGRERAGGGQRRAPASPELPPAPGAEGRPLPFPGAAASGGAHGAGRVAARSGCRTVGATRPRARPARPRQGKRSRCQTTCSAAGEEGGMGGCEGRKEKCGGRRLWWCEEHGEARGVPRPRASRGRRKAGWS